MRIHLIFLVVILASLVGCAIVPQEQQIADPKLPEQYASQVQRETRNGCSIIQGKYNPTAISFQLIEDHYEPFNTTQYGTLILKGSTGHRQKEFREELDAPVPEKSQHIEITQDHENNLTIRSFHMKEPIAFVTVLERGRGFKCEEGFIVFPLSVYYGGTEGVSLNSQSQVRVVALENGSLLVQRVTMPYKRSAIRSAPWVKEYYSIFTRFEP